MGVFYIVWPLDEQMREHLESEGIHFPDAASRWPSSLEIRKVLDSLSGFEIEYLENGPGQRWSASITEAIQGGWWTLLHAEPKEGDDDWTEVTFEKGEPALVAAIVQSLSRSTGPLTIVADADGTPVVVTADKVLAELLQEWAHGAEDANRFARLLRNVPGAVA